MTQTRTHQALQLSAGFQEVQSAQGGIYLLADLFALDYVVVGFRLPILLKPSVVGSEVVLPRHRSIDRGVREEGLSNLAIFIEYILRISS